jgi:hypothetical protein
MAARVVIGRRVGRAGSSVIRSSTLRSPGVPFRVGTGTAERHAGREFPVQRGETVTVFEVHRHGRGVMVDHGADDSQVLATVEKFDQARLARPVDHGAGGYLPEPAQRIVRVEARADGGSYGFAR